MKYNVFSLAATLLLCNAVYSQTSLKSGPRADTLSLEKSGKSVKNFSKVVGWKDGETPLAPAGFSVTKYSGGLENPRKMYVLPNGDVLVAEAATINSGIKKAGAVIVGAAKSENQHVSVKRITLLRYTKGTGMADVKEIFLENLEQPFGMLLLDGWLYVANTNSLIRYPYKTGQTKMTAKGEKILDLNGNGRHWTRNLLASEDGKKIYIAVGSSSNIAEHGMDKEKMRANILEINRDGSGLKVFASGLRNPVGMAWYPGTHTLWATVNERDELGDNLVPDYFTKVKPGGFYGWPYSYWGQHVDTRVKDQKPELVKKAVVPDLSLGNHVAPLGMAFYTKSTFPAKYHNGAFIAEHGSWNSSKLQGYKVVFVPFSNGEPGKPEDFLTGFIADPNGIEVHGRPVDVVQLADGSMLVSDDVTNIIWRVTATK